MTFFISTPYLLLQKNRIENVPPILSKQKELWKNQASRFPSGLGILLVISRLPDCTKILINYNYNHHVAVELFFKTLIVSILDLATYISNIVIQPLQTPFRLAGYMRVHMIMYVRVCVCLCACACVWMCVCVWVCVRVCMWQCVSAWISMLEYHILMCSLIWRHIADVIFNILKNDHFTTCPFLTTESRVTWTNLKFL